MQDNAPTAKVTAAGIAGTAVTSDRSLCAWAAAPVRRSTVASGVMSVAIGFMARRTTSDNRVSPARQMKDSGCRPRPTRG